MDKYILFEVGGSTFGIPSGEVHHVEMMEHIAIVPNANPAIDGVVFSRGQVFPALNLRARFGFPRVENTTRTRLLFVQFESRVVGLVVDSAREFVSIPPDLIRPMSETLAGIDANFLKSVAQMGDRLILLVNLEAVLDVDQYEPAPLDAPAPQP